MKKNSKKIFKIATVIVLVIALFIICYFHFKTEIKSEKKNILVNPKITYGSYENAQKIVKEVMRDYYIKGSRMQYNFAKVKYGEESPEDATSQNIMYSVCAAYIYDVYKEAFGVNNNGDYLYEFPRFNSEVITNAREYYVCNDDSNFRNGFDCTKRDGNFLIYYQNTSNIKYSYISTDPNKKDKNGKYPKITKTITSKEKYIYNNGKTKNQIDDFGYFVNLIKPGDIFTYTGHVLIAYDVVERTDKDGSKFKDVLLLNSTQAPLIYTRIYGTTQLSNNMYKATKNNIIDNDEEGTLKYTWLSSQTEFVETKTEKNNEVTTTKRNINCSKEECVVIRPFYENKNGEAVFNYDILEENYKKSYLRTFDYPGLDIDKTVNKRDGNNVYLNDTLEYSIKITNKSNTTYNGKAYNSNKNDKFYIEEILDSKVEFVSSTIDGAKTSTETFKNNDGKLIWTISKKIEPGESVIIKYKVKVKNDLKNINEKIVSSGKFYKNNETSIRMANVENLIVTNKQDTQNKSYKKCFDENKSKYSGLDLVNKVYYCSTGKDYKFNNFKFENIFSRKQYFYTSSETNENKYYSWVTSDAISLKSNSKIDSNNIVFKNMILNNYWSGTFYYAKNDKNGNQVMHMILPKWSGKSAKNRAENIYSSDLKDGDILIYSIQYTDDDCNGIPGGSSWKPQKGACTKVYNNKHTTENGVYAFIYIDGTFKGINGTGDAERNDFIYDYYKDYTSKGSETNRMYKTGYSKLVSLTGSNQSEKFNEVMTFNNLQTLYEKDYYVILRPSLLNEYAIKYNSNGGTGTMNTVSAEYDKNYTLDANTFKRTGYTFAGWNTKSDGTGTKYTDKQQVKNLNLMNSMSVTLYASWKANNYTVKFDANGGTGTMSNQSMTYGVKTNLTQNAFKRTGYTFTGWNTKSDGSGKTYNDKNEVSKLTSTNNETVTLYAIWKANNYTVKFNANSGTGTMSNQSMTYGVKTNITKNKFKRSGYTFANWNTKSDGTGTNYTDGQQVSNLTSKSDATVTLYAQWTQSSFEITGYKESNGIITGIEVGTTVKQYKSKLSKSTDYEIKLYNNKSKEMKETDVISTGSNIKIYSDGKIFKEYTNVVFGDTTGDGIINIADVIKLADHTVKKNVLSDSEKKAADVTNDSALNIADVIKLADYTIDKKIQLP